MLCGQADHCTNQSEEIKNIIRKKSCHSTGFAHFKDIVVIIFMLETG